MGRKLGALFFGLALFTSTTLRAETPGLVSVNLAKAYVPIGFDDNDKSEISVVGQLPNSCYKVGPARHEVDKANKVITVEQSAYVYLGMCLQVIVPFSQRIDLGILEEGNYQIKDAASGTMLGMLPIGRAKSESADEFLYAPVTDAQIRTHDGKSFLFLQGSFTDRCMSIKEVKIHYYSDVIVVQPIAQYSPSGADECGFQMIRYRHEVPLKDGLTGEMLIHVRSMDGQAVNRFIAFP